MLEFDEPSLGPKIKVVGVGGGGGNAVNTMIEAGIQGVDFVAANTDCQVLETNQAPTKIQIGKGLTKDSGLAPTRISGARPPSKTPSASARLSRAPTWFSLPLAWAAVPVPARRLSSHAQLAKWVLSPSVW